MEQRPDKRPNKQMYIVCGLGTWTIPPSNGSIAAIGEGFAAGGVSDYPLMRIDKIRLNWPDLFGTYNGLDVQQAYVLVDINLQGTAIEGRKRFKACVPFAKTVDLEVKSLFSPQNIASLTGTVTYFLRTGSGTYIGGDDINFEVEFIGEYIDI